MDVKEIELHQQVLSMAEDAGIKINRVTVRKLGQILELSLGAVKGPPKEVCRLLEPHLRFDKTELLYGAAKFDPITGIERKVNIVTKHLYRYDAHGRMIFGAGFWLRVRKLLEENGFQIDFHDMQPDQERERPDCYQPVWENVTNAFDFRARQEECLRAVIESQCGVIHAPTGFGKLYIIGMICLLFPKAKIAVVTKSKNLVKKIHDFLTRYIPNVGMHCTGCHKTGRVTVYTSRSFHYSDHDEDWLLCDEAHELMAEQASMELAKSLTTRNVALTASPTGRLDNADIRMESLFGTTIFYMPYSEAVKLGLVVPIRVEWSAVNLNHNPCAGKSDAYKERWGIWRNEDRNEVIAKKARTFDAEEQVQIIVRTIEHAVHLRKHLPEYQLVYDQLELTDRRSYERNGLMTPDDPKMTASLRDQMRVAFEAGKLKKVIATGVWSVGISPDQMTALIRADATASEISDIQAPGRVCRTHSETGKEVGIVCDFLDNFDDGYKRKSKTRYRNYQKMEWEQVKMAADERFSENALRLQ